MNFNLISKDGNGYDYTTRFRDDIVIKANSKVYLNFCEISKVNEINLNSDQAITLTAIEMLPPVQVQAPWTVPNSLSGTSIIKKGFYTYKNFQTAIQDALNSMVANKNQAVYYTANITDYNPLFDTDLNIGYFLDMDNNKLLELDGVNKLNYGVDPADATRLYVKSSVTAPTPVYDCYGLSSTHYNHYAYVCPDESRNNNLLLIRPAQNMDTQTGRVCVGLYSTEYMSYYSGGQPIITGNTFVTVPTPTVATSLPRCFLTIEFLGANTTTATPTLRISCSRNTALESIRRWDSPDKTIDSLEKMVDIPFSEIYDNLSAPASIGFQTYYETTNNLFKGDNRKLFFRLFKILGTQQLHKEQLIYDSSIQDVYFSNEFFHFPSPTSTAEVNSSIPFKVLMSSTVQNEGFNVMYYKEFDKSLDTATEPRSVIESYKLDFTTELKAYIGVSETPLLYPNVCEIFENSSVPFYYTSGLSLDFLNDSYSVIIDQLPIKNFKNKQCQEDGGYSQNILANIPAPFVQSVNNLQKNDTLISCVYQPSFKIINSMKNQKFITNQLRVKIIRMLTDKPATELKKSVVNFTIYNDE